MANLSWARNAVLDAAVREIEWEAKQAATTPTKSQQIVVVFQAVSPSSDLNGPQGRKWQTARFAPSQHNDLLSQHQDLGLQRRAWPEQINDSLKNYPAEIQHAAEDHPILRLMPTG
jgi:hypothetical protein